MSAEWKVTEHVLSYSNPMGGRSTQSTAELALEINGPQFTAGPVSNSSALWPSAARSSAGLFLLITGESGGAARAREQPNQPALAEQHAAMIAEACRLIAESEEAPDLEALANHVGMSRYHFHRVFKAITGLTPHDYVVANRMQKVRKKLGISDTVTEAMYDAGYNSSGRFYETTHEVLGMTPSHFRAGGARTDIRFAIGECSLGSILIARSDRGVCAILLGDDPDVLVRDLQDTFPRANLIGGDGEFEHLVASVVGFVETPAVGLDLPLDIRGTAFQQRVWQALREIPAGETASYSEIARRISSPKSVRAVAQACSANTLAVAIPCHRVVRNDGSLSGYRWGVERKRALLKREAQV